MARTFGVDLLFNTFILHLAERMCCLTRKRLDCVCIKMYSVIWATGKQYEIFHGFLLKLPTDDKQWLCCHDWNHTVRYNDMIDIYSFSSNGKLTKWQNCATKEKIKTRRSTLTFWQNAPVYFRPPNHWCFLKGQQRTRERSNHFCIEWLYSAD